MTLPSTTEPEVDRLQIVASQLRIMRRLPGVTGALVATTDGRSYVTDLQETSPGSAAAITASSLGLATRVGELTGEGSELMELQVRSDAGYVCVYVINPGFLLGVVTSHTVNLARLKLDVRDAIAALDKCLPGVS